MLQVVYDNLQSDHYNCKKKFPEDFYPGVCYDSVVQMLVSVLTATLAPKVRWSRKGYLHTRWKMFGRYAELVKGHLNNKHCATLVAFLSRVLNLINIHLVKGHLETLY